MAHLEPIITDRGFKRFDPVPNAHGGEVRVYESSAANHPHIWLQVTCPVNANHPDGPAKEATAHLRIEDAETLRDQLSYLINNHYQR